MYLWQNAQISSGLNLSYYTWKCAICQISYNGSLNIFSALVWNRLWIKEYRNLLLKWNREEREREMKSERKTHAKSFCRGNVEVTAVDEVPSLHWHDILSLWSRVRQVFPTLVHAMLLFCYSQDLQGMKRIPFISRDSHGAFLPSLPSFYFSVQDWSNLFGFHSSRCSLRQATGELHF